MQEELAALAGRSTWERVDAADHTTLVTDPDHARATVDAVRRILAATPAPGGAHR